MAETMLIIDDDAMVLKSCRAIFEKEGFEVSTTQNPEEGLNLATRQAFDAVLVDWMIPGFDGMDVVEEIDRRSPNSALIMISGHPSVGRATEAMQRGAMDYVPKPFKPEEIIHVVRKAVQRKMAEEKQTVGRCAQGPQSRHGAAPPVADTAAGPMTERAAQDAEAARTPARWIAVSVMGMLAGAGFGMGGLLATLGTWDAAARLGTSLSNCIAGSLFGIGLIFVVLAGGELFAGNSLISGATSGALDIGGIGKLTQRSGLVWVANFVGALLVVLLFYYSGLWKNAAGAVGEAAMQAGYSRLTESFSQSLWRGIGGNWLICLALWMALSTRQILGRIFACFLPVMALAAIGLEHCVASMYYVPAAILLHSWAGIPPAAGMDAGLLHWSAFVRHLLPVTLGNLIGGMVFAGMIYWGAYARPSR